jgi:hypothetical protein
VPVRAAATAPLGVHGCPLRRLLPRCLPHQLELVVFVLISRNIAADATGAQSLELCRRRCCFYFCPCCCQFRHCQPCRPCRHRCSGNLDLLPVLRARDDQALRLSFGHNALVGAATWGRGCFRRAAARLCSRGGISRDNRCSCYRLRTERGMKRG